MEPLSKAEESVRNYIVQGYSNKEIGDLLCVCEKTIKFHLTNIYKKENVSSRSELISKHYGHSKKETESIRGDFVQSKNQALPVNQDQRTVTQQDKIQFIDKQFKVGDTVNHLHNMMKDVTRDGINPATVNAACNCVARLNETINTAIQAARFLNER